jgi:predicted site-specific integrase-resolvase
MNNDELIGPVEVAAILDVARGTVYNYVRRGLIKRYRIKTTGRKVFKRSEIEHFADNWAHLVDDTAT